MNRMYFGPDDKNYMFELIRYLCDYTYNNTENLYADVHIRPEDLGAFSVEWDIVPWSGEYGGRFEYVDENQLVVNEVYLPDGSYEYTEEDPKDYLKEWLEYNPQYDENSQEYKDLHKEDVNMFDGAEH